MKSTPNLCPVWLSNLLAAVLDFAVFFITPFTSDDPMHFGTPPALKLSADIQIVTLEPTCSSTVQAVKRHSLHFELPFSRSLFCCKILCTALRIYTSGLMRFAQDTFMHDRCLITCLTFKSNPRCQSHRNDVTVQNT